MRRLISLLILISLFSCAGILCAEEPQVGSSAETSVTSAAPKIDTGDTAWMIVATAFVMLMTLPGLPCFTEVWQNGKIVSIPWQCPL